MNVTERDRPNWWHRMILRLDPETAHQVAIQACRVGAYFPFVAKRVFGGSNADHPRLRMRLAGMELDGPLGLAAGWDKSGHAVGTLLRSGFGHIEIGSVSADPSMGNSKPRLFRLPRDRALVVNYGLPNDGSAAVADRIHRLRNRMGRDEKPRDATKAWTAKLGINLVMTNRGESEVGDTPDQILDDYRRSLTSLHRLADYIMLNLSCPNADGGKDFFSIPGNTASLLKELRSVGCRCPLFLKIQPRDSAKAIDAFLSEIDPFAEVKGIMFNLSAGQSTGVNMRSPHHPRMDWKGALSGRPIREQHDACVRRWYVRLPKDRYQLISAGGISCAEDAYRRIKLGASAVQVYTALIYQGPALIRSVHEGLLECLDRDGISCLADAVGVDA